MMRIFKFTCDACDGEPCTMTVESEAEVFEVPVCCPWQYQNDSHIITNWKEEESDEGFRKMNPVRVIERK